MSSCKPYESNDLDWLGFCYRQQKPNQSRSIGKSGDKSEPVIKSIRGHSLHSNAASWLWVHTAAVRMSKRQDARVAAPEQSRFLIAIRPVP